MKISHLIGVILAAVLVSFFLSQKVKEQPPKQSSPNQNINVRTGKIIYVPVYSYISSDNNTEGIDLENIVSIHNTDCKNSIIINLVNYYNSDGELITSYLEQPIEILPLGSKNFVVPKTQTRQGASASLIVEWVAQEKVSEPIVEAVMISSVAPQGVSWVSQGQPLGECQL